MAFQKPPTVSDDYRAHDIYRAAAKIIFAKGFDATSMGDIADAVDLTKGGLYYYIKGKKALLFAIMNFAMDLVEEKVIVPAQKEPDADTRLAGMIAGHMRLLLEDPAPMSILLDEEEGLDEEYRERLRARKREYYDLVRDTVAAVLREHGQDDVDPTVATNVVVGMVHWAVRWFRRDGPLGEDEVIDQMTKLALYGLIPRT